MRNSAFGLFIFQKLYSDPVPKSFVNLGNDKTDDSDGSHQIINLRGDLITREQFQAIILNDSISAYFYYHFTAYFYYHFTVIHSTE